MVACFLSCSKFFCVSLVGAERLGVIYVLVHVMLPDQLRKMCVCVFSPKAPENASTAGEYLTNPASCLLKLKKKLKKNVFQSNKYFPAWYSCVIRDKNIFSTLTLRANMCGSHNIFLYYFSTSYFPPASVEKNNNIKSSALFPRCSPCAC